MKFSAPIVALMCAALVHTAPIKDAAPIKVAIRASPTKDAVRASPTKDAVRASPTKDAVRASPTKDAVRASPTKDANRASPSKDANRASPTKDAIRASPTKDAIHASPIKAAILAVAKIVPRCESAAVVAVAAAKKTTTTAAAATTVIKLTAGADATTKPLPVATPKPTGLWQPQVGAAFQIVLSAVPNPNVTFIPAKANIIDLDLFDNTKATIDRFHAQGKKVICYFSAGSSEDWRPDFGDFLPTDFGLGLATDSTGTSFWPGEKWLNTKSTNVMSIMQRRLLLASQKGCDGVDPDNIGKLFRSWRKERKKKKLTCYP
jgi:hypothetical protein